MSSETLNHFTPGPAWPDGKPSFDATDDWQRLTEASKGNTAERFKGDLPESFVAKKTGPETFDTDTSDQLAS